MKISFAKNGDWREKMRLAFMLRFGAKADFLQEEDAVADPLDKRFFGDYAYVGALTNETFGNGTEIGLRCSFEGSGAPMLMLTDDCTLDRDGDAHYGGCVEVVIWKNGLNVWRHKLNETGERVGYHQEMGVFTPLAEGKIHDLRIKVDGKMLLIDLNGMRYSVHIPDMPAQFWVGAAVCEGVNRLYDLDINERQSFDDFMTWEDEDYPVNKVEV